MFSKGSFTLAKFTIKLHAKLPLTAKVIALGTATMKNRKTTICVTSPKVAKASNLGDGTHLVVFIFFKVAMLSTVTVAAAGSFANGGCRGGFQRPYL